MKDIKKASLLSLFFLLFVSQVEAGIGAELSVRQEAPSQPELLHITRLDDPDPRIQELRALLREKNPEFYALGGDLGQMYLVRTHWSAFVLSSHLPGRSRAFDGFACPKGSRLALERELREFTSAQFQVEAHRYRLEGYTHSLPGVRDLIPDLVGFWGWEERLPDSQDYIRASVFSKEIEEKYEKLRMAHVFKINEDESMGGVGLEFIRGGARPIRCVMTLRDVSPELADRAVAGPTFWVPEL